MKKYLFVLAAVALLFACKKEEKTAAITVGVDEITYSSAVLKGKAVLGPTVSADWKVGFQYSTSPGIMPANSTTVEAADADAKYNYSVTIEGLTPETTYYFRAFIRENGQDTYGETKEFKTGSIPKGTVDLGIVFTREDGSTYHLFWAESNLCETGLCANPEDGGDYYAWGETEPYYEEGYSQENPCTHWRSRTAPAITGYNWASYKWCDGTDKIFKKYNLDSKYGAVDGLTELQRGEKPGETVDDAARAGLGGKWRTPTAAEWKALIAQCTSAWTYNYNGTGIPGMIVTSNVEGYKDKSIFLPAMGYRFNVKLADTRAYGYYMSSSIPTNAPNVMGGYVLHLEISSYNNSSIEVAARFRCNGYSIRPVTE